MNDPIHALIKRVETQRRSLSLPSPAARRQLRESLGLTQGDFADALGVSRTCISLWERGERYPRPAQRERYLALLSGLTRVGS